MAATRSRPTLPDTPSRAQQQRGLWGRRAGIAALVAIVALSLFGFLGQRTSVVRVSGGGYDLAVTYPSIARPGMDVRLEIAVTRARGFGKQLTLALDRHYFDIIDLNSLRPDPDSSTSNGSEILYTWDSPPGERFQLSLDAYAEYGEHLGLPGAVSVLDGGTRAITARFATRLVP